MEYVTTITVNKAGVAADMNVVIRLLSLKMHSERSALHSGDLGRVARGALLFLTGALALAVFVATVPR